MRRIPAILAVSNGTLTNGLKKLVGVDKVLQTLRKPLKGLNPKTFSSYEEKLPLVILSSTLR